MHNEKIAMKNIELNQINLQAISSLPTALKSMIIIGVSVVLVMVVYWFDFSSLVVQLEHSKSKATTLRHDFIAKHPAAAQFGIYQNQYQQLEQQFDHLVHHITNDQKNSALLDKIQKMLAIDGLQVIQIKPQPAMHQDYLTIWPFEILLHGSYHQFARLITQLTNLDQLVTIHNFALKSQTTNGDDKLQMDLVLYVYQYDGHKVSV